MQSRESSESAQVRWTGETEVRCVPVLPADDPVQSFGADVEGFSDQRVVQVQVGRGGVGAGGVQADRWEQRRQTFDFLK